MSVLGRIVERLRPRPAARAGEFSSAAYWDGRYRSGGNSGSGSYGKFAEYKAAAINAHVAEHGLTRAIEFGCGDGNQAALLEIADYTGIDISPKAVALCREKLGHLPGRHFFETADRGAYSGTYDLALSLDVIYHLVEDEVFDRYMADLFDHAGGHVMIYASDHDEQTPDSHVRHRRHSAWVAANRPDWTCAARLENPHAGPWPEGSFAFFTLYRRG
ncbi:hypothetical protein LNKW23_25350 [Paralimibaculum aggregatum]|uniref:Methyltransferase type 12 domain-containing protein n=1 Tax=Paralimibaculum aggregatum TaxID=3036245 RepID=A0ABQ6LK07_9RHOB|nr:class I SAM-dependent methyltransferase [Limibaculum sp. NKW23]GMG83322.1 hypothetical protein LNKW23_25350 [Limibaculum sp. NKW23]